MALIFRAKSVVAELAKSNPKSAHKTSRARSVGAIISNAGDLQGLLILVKCRCPKRIRLATGHNRLGKVCPHIASHLHLHKILNYSRNKA
jgi:hypothetical protein